MPLADRDTVTKVAHDWMTALNGHDPWRAVARFSDAATATSPLIELLRPASGGRLFGKPEVITFYIELIALVPDLRLDLVDVLQGVDQITVLHRNQAGVLGADTMMFGSNGLVNATLTTFGSMRS